jgi:GT2 family glycosyltransferase
MNISVVICTLNRSTDVLRSLNYFAFDRPFELILVDQSDQVDPRVTEFVKQNNFRYLHLSEKSLPKSRNTGITAVTGDIILFVDDDVEPLPGFLKAHVEAFSDPAVWGTTGPVFDPSGPRIVLSEHDANWMPGCNMAIRASALMMVGSFNPIFEIHCDDAEMSHRLKAAGGRLRYVPQAQLIHHFRQTGGTRNDATKSAAYIRKYVRSLVYFNLLLGRHANHNTRSVNILRRFILSRSGYREGRIGFRQLIAFTAGLCDAHRAFRTK